jgi:hypothetical protein
MSTWAIASHVDSIHASNHLLPEGYARMTELRHRTAELPGDVADLTLVTILKLLKSSAQPG